MPIIVPDQASSRPFYDHLSEAGVATISTQAALRQDVRPARIALLNLMPATAMAATEVQWLRTMSRTILQVEVVPMKFDNDPRNRDGGTRQQRLAAYTPFSQAIRRGLDGLIITGDNLELDKENTQPTLLPFDRINYAEQLHDVIDWADKNVHVGIYSCLGSHFALDHFYGLEREVREAKLSGVFDHVVSRVASPFTANLDDRIRAPHSRWGDIPTDQLSAVQGLDVLASHRQIGWLLAAAASSGDGHRLFIQGHPEYDRNDLDAEYQRDRQTDPTVTEPVGYYGDDDKPRLSWQTAARALHGNIIDTLYAHFSDAAPVTEV